MTWKLALWLLAATLLAGTLLTGLLVAGLHRVAALRRPAFLAALGRPRLVTACQVVEGRGRIPGSLALTDERLAWDAPLQLSGSVAFGDIQKIETDRRRSAGGPPLWRAEVLRITVAGKPHEFVLRRDEVWRWRSALGDWLAEKACRFDV